ncbi:hypothetical protein C8F04DRAFT_1132048 [Mycena alexandri]|uniref:Uncharacterized protein n=1 Tax=Mycena alexandri TaxID=1745969 RepID=A0AAD6SB72_9AGAR|nr:hypothetical protein C8F04DRAFT_1132048 [Mycena alexandri]
MQTLESVVLRIDFFPGKPTMPQGQGFPAPAHYVPAYPQTPHTSGDDVPLPFVNDTLNHPSPHQYAYAPAAPYVEAAQVNPFASYQYAEESTCAPGDDIPNLEAYPQTDFSVSWDPLLAYDASTQTGQSHCILTSEEYNSEVYHHFTPPAQVAYDAQMPTGQPQFVPPFEEYPYSQTDSESMASSTMYLSQEELDASTPSSTVSPITPQPETFIARS